MYHARDQEARVAKLLTPLQHRRFTQIALQFLGPQAFSDPAVAHSLQLTPQQKQRIRPIQESAARPDPRAVEAIVALLTDTQRQQWAELVGEPFTGDFDFGHPPGPPRFPKGPPGPRRAPNHPN